MLNLWAFETDVFCCSERLVCYMKSPKSFFHGLLSRSMKWEYTGLQGVTKGYKGLQGVTEGYKGLQGVRGGYKGLPGATRGYTGLQKVTRGYKEFQGVTKDYRNFCLTRTFAGTFSWSILYKNQS